MMVVVESLEVLMVVVVAVVHKNDSENDTWHDSCRIVYVVHEITKIIKRGKN